MNVLQLLIHHETVDDDQDDEMQEPTQTMNAEKRKVDETAKRVTGTFYP